MKKTFLTILFLTQATMAQMAQTSDLTALQPSYAITQKEGYTFSREFFSKEPVNFKQLLNSTFRFGNCSGTFISKSGHVLTALHCLENLKLTSDSIRWGQRKDPQTSQLVPAYLTPASAFRIDDISYLSIHDILRIDFLTLKNPLVGIRVLYKGKAVPISFPYFDPTNQSFIIKPEELKLGKEMIQDFAIIQVDPSELKRPWACAQVRKEQVTATVKTYTVGYPIRWNRMPEVNFLPVISEGLTTASDAQMGEIRMQMLLPENSSYVSTAPLAQGMSGGGIFDQDARLMGVNSISVNDGQIFGRKNYHVSVAYILKILKDQNQDFILQKAFDCP